MADSERFKIDLSGPVQMSAVDCMRFDKEIKNEGAPSAQEMMRYMQEQIVGKIVSFETLKDQLNDLGNIHQERILPLSNGIAVDNLSDVKEHAAFLIGKAKSYTATLQIGFSGNYVKIEYQSAEDRYRR